MHEKVLIVTNEMDPHADHVTRRLIQRGHRPARLHPSDLPMSATLSLVYSQSTRTFQIESIREKHRYEDFRSIWWRRPLPHDFAEDLSLEDLRFAKKEFEHALNGMWESLGCYWMSRPSALKTANYKPLQLTKASLLGFEIPRTLITNKPEEALDFFDACKGEVIFKVLSDPAFGRRPESPRTIRQRLKTGVTEIRKFAPTYAYATILKRSDLEEHLPKLRHAPCQFQEYVPKQVELRIIVIGGQVFAAQIDSQSHERTKIDWRHYDVPMRLAKACLPNDIEKQCLLLVKTFGLSYSAIDMILTPDGRYVFLESNPNGQWLFVEQHVPELPLTDTLCDCLLNGKD